MASNDRRSLQDRRRRDAGPPFGCAERRVIAERRLPKLEEHAMSDDEWRVYFGSVRSRKAVPSRTFDLLDDRSADIPTKLWSDF